MKTVYEPKASRLPVRQASSGLPTSPAATLPEPRLQETTPSPPLPVEDPIDRLLNPSPGRYIHGAPLHNVMEEESEE